MTIGSSYAIFDIYRNAGSPLVGTINGANWTWPGTACTASTFKIYPAMLAGKCLLFARWVLAWNPSTGPSPTAVRLVVADDGPSNIVQIAEQVRTNANSPFDDTVDVTAALSPFWNACQADGTAKNIGHQTAGNGQNGALIYSSWVEMLIG